MAVDKTDQKSATEKAEKTEGAKTEAKEEPDKTADKTGRVERRLADTQVFKLVMSYPPLGLASSSSHD